MAETPMVFARGSRSLRSSSSPSLRAVVLRAIVPLALVFTGCSAAPNTPPGACGNVQCRAPQCCGTPCSTDMQCCRGTVCSAQGTCVPSICRACGALGCLVDQNACTARCAPPTCCLRNCATDADCCEGAQCLANSSGVRQCFPLACRGCSGLRNTCRTQTNCDIECIAPPSCGTACTSDAQCGSNNYCNSFLDGTQRCVPMAFRAECAACGSGGCLLHTDTCTVECRSQPIPDAGMPPADVNVPPTDVGTPPTDAADPSDVATVPPVDAATSPTCAVCCQPCTTNADCCPGNTCGTRLDTGARQCIPAACSRCEAGCTFQCPR